MTTTPGNEVLAYCGSCKMDLMAMIVAKVGSKIVKVQCKTCKKERAYKPAKGVKEPGQVAKPATRTRTSSAQSAEEPRTVSIESEWRRLMDEAEKSPRLKYSPKTKLDVGNVVAHPSFGEGIVLRLSFPDKAEILFKSDIKLLIHSR